MAINDARALLPHGCELSPPAARCPCSFFLTQQQPAPVHLPSCCSSPGASAWSSPYGRRPAQRMKPDAPCLASLGWHSTTRKALPAVDSTLSLLLLSSLALPSSMAWASSYPWRPPPLLLPQASRRFPLPLPYSLGAELQA
jgi:hypothetical protein